MKTSKLLSTFTVADSISTHGRPRWTNNLIEGNSIIDAAADAIYVVNGVGKRSPNPSIANSNRVLSNVIYDTRNHDASRFVGLRIASRNNIVKGNKVSMDHGRNFKAIKAEAGNQDLDNVYGREVGKGDVDTWIRARDQIKALAPTEK